MMGDDDKPFACTASGCGMRFTNVDHLVVHKKKHEMTLSFEATSNSKTNKDSTLFVDQTPTPTRFIRNCEEVGLFQDLQNVNPFEETFRKAAANSGTGNSSEAVPLPGPPSENDALNTPSVLRSSIGPELKVATSTTSAEQILDIPASESTNVQPTSTTTDNEINGASTCIESNHSSSLSLETSNSSVLTTSATTTTFVTQEPVVSSVQSNGFLSVQHNSEMATSITPIINSVATVHTSPVTTVLTNSSGITSTIMAPTSVVQLLLKLPDGRSIPVQIPAVPLVTTTIAPSHAPTSASITTISPVQPTTIAKMVSHNPVKLKAALHQNQTQTAVNISNSINNNLSRSSSRTTTISMQRLHQQPRPEVVQQENKQVPQTVKKRRLTEEDPDEKRRRFLERNRAAATRCRLKRKQWIQSLEKKADELSATNSSLQYEVSMLRNEVAQLKTMLLAHKDCPITLQQQAQGQIEADHAVPDDGEASSNISSAEVIASSALTHMAHSLPSITISNFQSLATPTLDSPQGDSDTPSSVTMNGSTD